MFISPLLVISNAVPPNKFATWNFAVHTSVARIGTTETNSTFSF